VTPSYCSGRETYTSRYESLQANLVFLADTGRRAFIEAEQQMDKLVMHSKYLFSDTGVVSLLGVATLALMHILTLRYFEANRIVDALRDEASAPRTLEACMEDLKEGIEECEAAVEAVETKFGTWLDIAEELSQVATDSERELLVLLSLLSTNLVRWYNQQTDQE
jgi:hypothetical protein